MRSLLPTRWLLAIIFMKWAAAGSFGYNATSFLLNGEPYQIIGGQIDPQRVPWQYWPQRLSMARAMGLNTVFSYIYWNELEPTQGQYSTDVNNNIYAFLQDAQAAGLQVVLRVGPFICGEHEWGGFPAWLNNIPNMVVRSNNGPFLDAVQSYISWLGNWIGPLMVTNGGPVLMVQVENEYGFYGGDHTYTAALAKIFNSSFPVPLYTNDGSSQGALQAGQIPNVLAEIDGGPNGFPARAQYLEASSAGPNLDGEYYITWLDQWASNNTHQSDQGNTAKISSVQSDLSWTLSNGDSFSIYMFHGGTNWGFQNGADYNSATKPITTSYDYGAPLDESGRTTDIYDALRTTLSSFQPAGSVPDVPKQQPMIEIPSITVEPYLSLFDALPSPVSSSSPMNMEALGQWYGFTLYRTTISSAVSGVLQPGVAAKDRVIVYVNGERVGVFDSIYETQQVVALSLHPGDVLDLFNENLGRVNFGPDITSQTKGVFGEVTVGGTGLYNWDMYTFPLDIAPTAPQGVNPPSSVSSTSGPVFYSGSFDLATVSDTWLELPGWTKGVVYVNGWNLGRYWTIGPQQSYYMPGCYLQGTGNVIQVLALEPTGKEGALRGVTTRTWGNNPDPDAP
ncbi:hypothetical protein MMC13_003818 [Lambiella insularis]|nr:hypothetical protein [Lambiella insularis]